MKTLTAKFQVGTAEVTIQVTGDEVGKEFDGGLAWLNAKMDEIAKTAAKGAAYGGAPTAVTVTPSQPQQATKPASRFPFAVPDPLIGPGGNPIPAWINEDNYPQCDHGARRWVSRPKKDGSGLAEFFGCTGGQGEQCRPNMVFPNAIKKGN